MPKPLKEGLKGKFWFVQSVISAEWTELFLLLKLGRNICFCVIVEASELLTNLMKGHIPGRDKSPDISSLLGYATNLWERRHVKSFIALYFYDMLVASLVRAFLSSKIPSAFWDNNTCFRRFRRQFHSQFRIKHASLLIIHLIMLNQSLQNMWFPLSPYRESLPGL